MIARHIRVSGRFPVFEGPNMVPFSVAGSERSRATAAGYGSGDVPDAEPRSASAGTPPSLQFLSFEADVPPKTDVWDSIGASFGEDPCLRHAKQARSLCSRYQAALRLGIAGVHGISVRVPFHMRSHG